MGRKPKPTAVKVLAGNPGHRPLEQASEPQVVPGLGAPPARITGDPEALRIWLRLGPELVKLGTMGETDRELFAGYCQAVSRAEWLSGRIQELRARRTLSGKQQVRLDTMESQLQKANLTAARFGAEFGIGAASRTRIRLPDTSQSELPLGDPRREPASPLSAIIALSRAG